MNILFGLMFTIVPVIAIGGIIFVITKGISEFSQNNAAPIVTVAAEVVGKRQETDHHTNTVDNMHHHHSSTSYYVTFQLENGQRLELSVRGKVYGQMAEGDKGQLTYQRKRYHDFIRQ